MDIKTNLLNNINILGFSEATLTMILDIFESNKEYPKIKVINNLMLPPTKKYLNPNFEVDIIKDYLEELDDLFILGVTKKETKLKVLESFKNIPTEKFIKIISKKSEISNTTTIGNGCIINPLVCIAGHTDLADFVFINRSVSIGHHTSIGKYTTINPGVNIAGNVKIGANCQIGMGTNIFDGVEVGNNVTIGGGSVVTRNIPDNVVAYGNPCKIIKYID